MRTVAACLLFVLAASVATAQSCNGMLPPTSDPLSTSVASTCGLAQTCQKNLCACTGGTGAFPGCLAANTGSCGATGTCYSAYFQCLMQTTGARQNTSDTACSTFGNSLYIAMMAAITGTSFNSSALAQSCNYNSCLLQNQTGATAGCANNTISAGACSSANLILTNAPPTNGTSTAPIVQTPAPTTPLDLVAVLRISGSAWANLLNTSAGYNQTALAIVKDLAAEFGVLQQFLALLQRLSLGSLIVTFGIYQGSGKSPAQLSTLVTVAAASSSWLKTLSTVYATVSNEQLTVLGVTVLSTAGPTTLAPGQTNVPAPGGNGNGSSSAASVCAWAVAAVAVVLGVFA